MIRRAASGDGAQLCDLVLRCPQGDGATALATDRTPDFFRRAKPFASSCILVAEEAGEQINATVTIAAKEVRVASRPVRAGYVFDLAVAPEARGRHLASRVLHQAEEMALAQGTDVLYAHVMRGNAASHATFVRAGFEPRATVVAGVFPLEERREDADGGGVEGAEGDVAEAWTPDQWHAAADLLAAAEEGCDLARGHDGPSLKDEWTGLTGWLGREVWNRGGALLGLWDHGEIGRYVLRRTGARDEPAVAPGEGLRAGMLLGGAGDSEVLAELFELALGRAGELGMRAVFTGFDERVEPGWVGARDSMREPYDLFVKVLRHGPAERLGDRPVRVDPIDL